MQRPSRNSSDTVANLMDSLSRFVLAAGGLTLLVSVGFLVFYFFKLTGDTENAKQATDLIKTFGQAAFLGGLVASIGASIAWWGEDILSPVLLIVSGALYFAPSFLPSMTGGYDISASSRLVVTQLQTAGGAMGVVAIIATVADIISRIRERVTNGSRRDTLKYGKDVKMESDKQNVLLGKCWQLPYCRKAVRDKCPIFHTKRTCWRERVGCMCEEKIIANAMSNVAIPKDIVAAAKYIPYNTKLPQAVKVQRCRDCVIYNEHQRHKYKVAMPGTVVVVAALYVVFRGPFTAAVAGLIGATDKFMGKATLGSGKQISQDTTFYPILVETVSVLLVIVLLAYLMKLIEHAIFNLKM